MPRGLRGSTRSMGRIDHSVRPAVKPGRQVRHSDILVSIRIDPSKGEPRFRRDRAGIELLMASIYDLKPAFQERLRPFVRGLAARGVTANQVTVAAFVLSLVAGALLLLFP